MIGTSPPPLPDWLEEELPFTRRVFTDAGHTMHFIDHGAGRPVLLQHGNPTWCYLWRKVIRMLVDEDVRIIVPDLIGFGLSSKPRDLAVHTLDFHADRVSALVRALDLSDLTIASQDWGGPIAAVMAARNPDRIRGAVFANTGIRVPTKPPRVTAFHRLSHMPVVSDLLFRGLNYPVKKMHLVQGDRSSIGPAERRAYLWPLRRIRDRAAPLALARLVPQSLSSPTLATLQEADDWARSFTGPVRLVWGRRDPILGKSVYPMKKLFPSADVTETGAGHFLQEEVPEELTAAILGVMQESTRGGDFRA
jgi:haloalkane dehalogenase